MSLESDNFPALVASVHAAIHIRNAFTFTFEIFTSVNNFVFPFQLLGAEKWRKLICKQWAPWDEQSHAVVIIPVAFNPFNLIVIVSVLYLITFWMWQTWKFQSNTLHFPLNLFVLDPILRSLSSQLMLNFLL